jgi:hypothetical protein
VPVALLAGTAPFTVSATNTYSDPSGHQYTRSLSITLQPTDEDGHPLQ